MQNKLQMFAFSKKGKILLVIEAENIVQAIDRANIVSYLHQTPEGCKIEVVKRGYFPGANVFFDSMLREWENLMEEIERG